MLRFVDIANALTLLALLAAAGSAWLAMSGQFAYAVISLIVAGLCDLFDGFVARRLQRTPEQREFGGHLDSLVDSCSFGFAPVVLLFAAGMRQPFDLVLLGLFVVCVIWRLAYFDTVGVETAGRSQYYIGLPTTYVALILPFVFLTAFAGAAWFLLIVRLTVVLLAIAMTCSMRFRKPTGLAYAFFLVLAVVIVTIFCIYAPRLQSHLKSSTNELTGNLERRQ